MMSTRIKLNIHLIVIC